MIPEKPGKACEPPVVMRAGGKLPPVMRAGGKLPPVMRAGGKLPPVMRAGGKLPPVMRAALNARCEASASGAGGGKPLPVMRAEPAQILRVFAPAKGTSATTLEESKYA